jgi:hypothetical protein
MKLRFLVALTAIAIATAACADAAPGPGDGPGDGPTVAYPTDPEAVVLRIDHEGGFVPMQYRFTSIPMFALYGDGTLIQPGAQIMIYPGPALPALVERPITGDAIDAVVRAAIEAGLDTDRELTDMGSTMIADAPTTVFTLSLDGRTYVTRVYALGELPERPPGMDRDEWETRAALNGFLEDLGRLPEWAPDGSLGDERMYAGRRARLLVGPYTPEEELPQEPKDWPLETPLSTFGTAVPEMGDGWRCGVVEGGQWETVRSLAEEANQLTPWRSDGESYSIVFRPLLPDESGC